MGEPRRIQLSRARGWRLADRSTNCKIVDRRSVYGNPWTISSHAGDWCVLLNASFPVLASFNTKVEAQERAVQWFRRWLTDNAWAGQLPEMGRGWILENLHELRGKDLCCWCAPGTPCHANVLLRLAAEAGGAE